MAIWHSFIAKISNGDSAIMYCLILAGNLVLFYCQMHAGDLATSYCLNWNNRVSSFYWTRGSKLCFLTCFSYLCCFLFYSSVFAKSLLTNFFAPFLAAWESNFLSCFLVPLALWAGTLYMRPHISSTECMGFLKQDAHRNLVVDSLPVFFPLSAFCQRFLVQTSIGQTCIYLSYSLKFLSWHFLAWHKPR